MEKKTIIKISIIAVIVIVLIIASIIIISKLVGGKNGPDDFEKGPDGKPLPVDMNLVKTISSKFHTEANSNWVGDDIMNQINGLNGQTLKALAIYYADSYKTTLLKDIQSVNAPSESYDEDIEGKLLKLGF